MSELNVFEEANRQLIICNACRYCEGYCPVFRAIETRRDFSKGDVFYLSNLCHDCRACYYACMFTPPHEFAINIPQVLSEARIASYQELSWPKAFARSFTEPRVGMLLAVFMVAIVAVFSLLLIPADRLFAVHNGPGAFYEVVPYLAMVIPALGLVLYGMLIWARSSVRFWSEPESTKRPSAGLKSAISAVADALGLQYLRGGGPGCFYPGEAPSSSRRIFHSLVFWGFISDFASTTLAYVYQDLFHWLPPYPLTSAPVIFGSLGGVALMIGVAGLIWCKRKSDLAPAASRAYSLDSIFLVMLGLTALTGMLTLTFRATAALGSLLIVHLGLVAALFMTAPYGKIVHALYRVLAIVKYHVEENGTSQKA